MTETVSLMQQILTKLAENLARQVEDEFLSNKETPYNVFTAEASFPDNPLLVKMEVILEEKQ